VPPHLLVLGGGYVDLELAQAYCRFGSRVTITERGPQLAGLVHISAGERTIEGSDILVAAGRSPNTAGIGLEAAGVALDRQ
jgi:pyruvate/2-oxoglutarate dehydrogenase complex dihydrolipoamide dehydrogenase (E3) component